MVANTMQYSKMFFIVISIMIALLFIISMVVTIMFYRYVLNYYILKVLSLYEKITLDKIQRYRNKCNKYKKSLKGK